MSNIEHILNRSTKEVADLMAEALTEQPQEWWDALIKQYCEGDTYIMGVRVSAAITDYLESLDDD